MSVLCGHSEKDHVGHLLAALRLFSASINFTADKSWASRAPLLAFPHLSPNNLDQEIFSSSGVIMTHYSSTVSASFDRAVAAAGLRARYLPHPPHLLQPFEGVSEPH